MRNHLTSVAFTLLALAIAVPAAQAQQAEEIFNNTNVLGASNGASLAPPPAFNLRRPTKITEISTYHWNSGQGAQPGTISIRGFNNQTWGPFSARSSGGQGHSVNVTWTATVNVVLPAGLYHVLDSDPITWSQNRGSSGQGFTKVYGFTYLPGVKNVPVNAPPPPPFFTPCNPSNNPIALVGPCVAPRAGLIWVQKVFHDVSPMLLEFVRVAPQSPTPPVRLIAAFAFGSTYTVRVSPLCPPTSQTATVTYNVFMVDTTGLFQGFVGSFTPDCR